MKRLLTAALLALAAAPALAANDCILDNCADQRPPATDQTDRTGPPSDGPSPRWSGGRGGSSGNFDFYVLALSWSPSFCATGGAGRSPAQCAPGANPGFVVHGLWPQYDNGYPSQCAGNVSLPYAVLSGLGDLYPDPGLARHEWRQHGLCSGKPPSGYFADVRAARAAITIPAALKAPEADLRLSPFDIQRAFIEANPRLRSGMMAVVCRRGLLQEARFCLSRDLRDFVACPQVVQQGCFSQSIVAPAAR
ncbi:ribonuclease T [Rhodoblastus sp.]|uniref:ribonuclease T2 family protein n=1 Tax=Rhodoblastus sp. TaxID=1962975 RepID=UPI0035B025CB